MKATVLSLFNNEATIISLNKYIEPDLNLTNTNHSVLVYNNGIYKKIYANEIIMIKAESNYSYIILENDEKIFTSRTIKHWTQTFNSASLLRIHKTYLVNVNKIKEINRKLNTLLLSDNHSVNYSRGMKKYLIEICHK